MKSRLTLAIIVTAILISTGLAIFFWQRPHLPPMQTPPPPGTFMLKNQLVFAGYKTPEAALESTFWALLTGDLNTFLASVPPKILAEMKKEYPSPESFKDDARTGENAGVKGVAILARKNISADKVELKFELIETNGTGASDETTLSIVPAVKIGAEWKLNLKAGYDYTPNWDNGGEIVTFAN